MMTQRKSNGKFEPNSQELTRTLNGTEGVMKPKKELNTEMAAAMWQPGQTGNPNGRPKAKNTIKEQLRFELEREIRIHTSKGEMGTKAIRQVSRNLISLLAFGEVTFPSKTLGGKTRSVRFSGNDWASHAVKILKYYEPGDVGIKEQKNYINFDIMQMLPADVRDNILKVQKAYIDVEDTKMLPSAIEGALADEGEMIESQAVEGEWWTQDQDENDEEAKLMQELIEDGESISYEEADE